MAQSKEEKLRKREERRDKRITRMKSAGIEDSKVWRKYRDKTDKDVDQLIRDFIRGKDLPPPNPSDMNKKEKEKYKPLPKGEGYFVLGWKDKTETVDGEVILNLKRDYRLETEHTILTDVYGNASTGAIGYIQQHGVGEFGIIETEIVANQKTAERIIKDMKRRDYTILYAGKCTRRNDLLAVLGALSLGFYSVDEKRLGIWHFIQQVKIVNPNQGNKLMEDYLNYYGKGY
jgi:hypothetical protein